MKEKASSQAIARKPPPTSRAEVGRMAGVTVRFTHPSTLSVGSARRGGLVLCFRLPFTMPTNSLLGVTDDPLDLLDDGARRVWLRSARLEEQPLCDATELVVRGGYDSHEEATRESGGAASSLVPLLASTLLPTSATGGRTGL